MVKVVLLLLVTISAHAADIDELYQRANRLYEEGQIAEAQQIYETLFSDGHHSADLFYNLGNAFYRQEKLGDAALNYERALALNPVHPEAKANLKFIRDKTGGKTARRSWRDYVFLELDRDIYAISASAAGWVVFFSLVALIFRRHSRAPLWTAAVLSMIVGAYSIAAIMHFARADQLAIVTAKQSAARTAPAETAAIVEQLPAASRVWILVERGDWAYVSLPGEARGWLPVEAIEKVVPRQS